MRSVGDVREVNKAGVRSFDALDKKRKNDRDANGKVVAPEAKWGGDKIL